MFSSPFLRLILRFFYQNEFILKAPEKFYLWILGETYFTGCKEALDQKQVSVLYPKGSRGKPGEMTELKKGIFHISQLASGTEVTPVLMHGLDKALPKGEALLVPFNCDVIVGEPRATGEDSSVFLEKPCEFKLRS